MLAVLPALVHAYGITSHPLQGRFVAHRHPQRLRSPVPRRLRSPVLSSARRESSGKLLGEDIVGFFDRWWSRRRERSHWRRDRPERIILVRHGESLGNTDKVMFSKMPDSQIALTDRGYAQAVVAGLKIRALIGNETVRFFHSPYMRTRQTLLAILRAFDDQNVLVSSEPRLREQDFGNFQDPEAMDAVFAERARFGRFFYRFPNGEAGTDVFDRMTTFITYRAPLRLDAPGSRARAPPRDRWLGAQQMYTRARSLPHDGRQGLLPAGAAREGAARARAAAGAQLRARDTRAPHAHLLHVLLPVDGAGV